MTQVDQINSGAMAFVSGDAANTKQNSFDGQKNRVGTGLVNPNQKLSFTFNGKTMSGFAGDTLASALLANGQLLVGRSFKYHRPRGIVSAGSEEPNALVGIYRHGDQTPNLRATQVELYQGLEADRKSVV